MVPIAGCCIYHKTTASTSLMIVDGLPLFNRDWWTCDSDKQSSRSWRGIRRFITGLIHGGLGGWFFFSVKTTTRNRTWLISVRVKVQSSNGIGSRVESFATGCQWLGQLFCSIVKWKDNKCKRCLINVSFFNLNSQAKNKILIVCFVIQNS